MPEKIYYQTQYESPLGTLTLGATGNALVGLWLPGQKYFAASVPVEMTPNNDLPIFLRTRDWLNRYFAGRCPPPPAGAPPGQEGGRPVSAVVASGVCAFGAGEAAGAGPPGTPPHPASESKRAKAKTVLADLCLAISKTRPFCNRVRLPYGSRISW